MEEEILKTTTNRELTQKDWLGVVLEEFKASRAENLEAGKHAQTTFQISIVGFSFLITSTVTIWGKEVIPDLMLFVFIPLFSYLVSIVWLGEVARRIRIAHFVNKVMGLREVVWVKKGCCHKGGSIQVSILRRRYSSSRSP